MEPTGIEPVTSCLQSTWEDVRRCPGRPIDAGHLGRARLENDAQDPSKSGRFRALTGRWRPIERCATWPEDGRQRRAACRVPFDRFDPIGRRAETRQMPDLALPSNYVAASLAFMHGAAAEHCSYLGRASIVREAQLIR